MSHLVDRCFSKADFDAIEAAVREAESGTVAEIVVQIAGRSKNWLLERLAVSSFVALIAFWVALSLSREDDWAGYFNLAQALLWLIVAFAVAYVVSYCALRTKNRRRKAVWERAKNLFTNLTPTRGQAGILLFMSIDEKKAAVVVDTVAASKLEQAFLDKLHTILIDGMKGNHHAEKLVEAVQMAGRRLAQVLPASGENPNELPDTPKIIT